MYNDDELHFATMTAQGIGYTHATPERILIGEYLSVSILN